MTEKLPQPLCGTWFCLERCCKTLSSTVLGESPESLGAMKPLLLLGLGKCLRQAELGSSRPQNLSSLLDYCSYSTGNKGRLGGICCCSSKLFFFLFIFLLKHHFLSLFSFSPGVSQAPTCKVQTHCVIALKL